MAATHAVAFTVTRAWGVDEFADLVSDPKCFATGDPSSFALLRVVADEAEVLTIATVPDHRRKGLARKALTEAEKEAATRGAAFVFLEVAEDNAAARALYAAMGYTPIGRRDGYYTPKNSAPVAALVLRKQLHQR
jgi:ribosomal-protein-alanine N-acetyltransferase